MRRTQLRLIALLLLFALVQAQSDCKGKNFKCESSERFFICVDKGDGTFETSGSSELCPVGSYCRDDGDHECDLTEPPATDPPVTDPPATDPPATDPPATDPPATDPPATDPPATDPPATDPPATDPPVTDPPATDPPATDPPATDPPATDPPATDPPATDPPATDPPATDPPATDPPVTDPPATDPPATDPPATDPPATDPPATDPPATDPPVTDPPATDPPATDPPATDPPATDPPATDPPVTDPPATDPPVTDPPATDPPVTDPPVTDPPVTDPPVTDPPVTDPPVTNPPVTDPPVTDPPSTSPPQPVCTSVGALPDPTDCRKYIICLRRIGGFLQVNRVCPPRFAFHPRLRICTLDLSPCGSTAGFQCSAPGRFADPEDPTKFYWCVRNLFGRFFQYSIQCPRFTIFDQTLGRCRLRLRSGGIIDISDSKLQRAISDDVTQNFVYDEIIDDNSSESKEKEKSAEKYDFTCESEGTFPDVNSCEKYFVCSLKKQDKFKKRHFKCPPNQQFDIESNVCADENVVNCV